MKNKLRRLLCTVRGQERSIRVIEEMQKISPGNSGAIFVVYESEEIAKEKLSGIRRDQVVAFVDAPVGTSSSRSRRFRIKGVFASLPNWAKREYRVVRIERHCVAEKCAQQLIRRFELIPPRSPLWKYDWGGS